MTAKKKAGRLEPKRRADVDPGLDYHDLGSGHRFAWVVGDPASFPTDDERLLGWSADGMTLVGIIEEHRRPEVEGQPRRRGTPLAWCGGAVNFVNPPGSDRPSWQVVSLDPLELAPSILCTAEGCGAHGFIRAGRWVPA